MAQKNILVMYLSTKINIEYTWLVLLEAKYIAKHNKPPLLEKPFKVGRLSSVDKKKTSKGVHAKSLPWLTPV